MSDCPRILMMIKPCHFEARYDSEPKIEGHLKSHSTEDSKIWAEAMQKRTYVHDICIRCGRIVERTHP